MQNRRRRVAILTEIISPYRIPVFNALANQEDLNLHVVFLSVTDARLRQWRIYRDEIGFSYEVLRSCRWRAGKHNVLLNWGLRRSLRKFSPDAIICGGYNYFSFWNASWWARRHAAELILWSESSRCDARAGAGWVESLKASFLAQCDRFVVPGSAAREYLKLLGSPSQSISIAPNAVDNGWFQSQASWIRARAPEFRILLGVPSRFLLFAGRLVREKGVFDLLEAYAGLKADLRARVALVFAGDGTCRTELERRAKRISPGRVDFRGFLHREELACVYALAEGLILPTHSDTWGLVVNEAMACGLPIVVTSVAGCSSDLVRDGWNGYVVAPRDVENLHGAIDRLVRNPDHAGQMGMRSAQRIVDYSPEACAQGLAAAAFGAASEVRIPC
jgi:glycosyltransferase involved in cell wall biosynthesis